MTQIAIVGGGTGGAVLANRLADRLAPELDAGDVEVTLIDERPEHVYKPTFLYVPFGIKDSHEARRPLRDLVDSRIDIRIDRVTGIDTDAKTLAFGDDEMAYDYLVLATGSRLVPEEVPGLAAGGHHFYSADKAERLRDALAEFESGRIVVSVIGVPHMCPAAPLEMAFMLDDWFRKRGLREDIEIAYTYPIMRIHGIPAIAEWAQPRFDERGIESLTFVNPESVDPDRKVLETMEGEEIEYDLLVAIPPHDGDPLIAESGLGEDGWVQVDKHTLEAEAAADVYAVGDAADVPTSKAGSVAHYQAGVVADRLAAQVRGQVPTARYDGKTICFIETGLDEATFVEFDYEDDPYVRAESRPIHWSKLAYNESYWLTARGLL